MESIIFYRTFFAYREMYLFQGYLCLPYLSLPYLDLLGDVNVRGYVVGATNVLFKQKKQLIDVLIEVNINIRYVLIDNKHGLLHKIVLRAKGREHTDRDD